MLSLPQENLKIMIETGKKFELGINEILKYFKLKDIESTCQIEINNF